MRYIYICVNLYIYKNVYILIQYHNAKNVKLTINNDN